MNKDQTLLAEAYTQIIEEAKKKLSKAQKKIAAAAPPPDEITGADFKALKKENKEIIEEVEHADDWVKKFVPYGYVMSKKYKHGKDENGREFVAWEIPDEGEVTYYHYLAFKDEGKMHDIDEDTYRKYEMLAMASK